MPTYSYKARNTRGQTEDGKIEAESKVDVARSLRGQGFVPIQIKEVSGKEASSGAGFLSNFVKFDIGLLWPFGGVSTAEKMIFSRHLAIMLSAGVPITRALKVLSEQTKNTKFKNAIVTVADDIRKGKRIAKALEKHPGVFNELYVSMVRAGDSAGNLTEILDLLAEQLKKDYELTSRVKGALMYPSVILIAMVGVGALMMTTVVPKISEIFGQLDVELPKTTQIVILTSDFLAAYWLFVLVSILPTLYLLRRLASTEMGKWVLSWTFLHLPVIRDITVKINSARFSRTLSSLTKGGVPILHAIDITKGTLGNTYYKRSMDSISKDVKKGKTLYESMGKFNNIYPGLIIQMVRVGEESGSLAETLIRIAEFYEEEVNNTTKNLSSIIEPVLMLVIGLVVGLFAISMIQPMYGLMGGI